MICDFYAGATWLDSCDATQYSSARLPAILAKRWFNVRMVAREAAADVVADNFSTWLMSV